MCECVYNRRGFLEVECFECVEEAARDDREREEIKVAIAEFLSPNWTIC